MSTFKVPDGSQYEGSNGLFYRMDNGELYYFNNLKGGWQMANHRPFIRKINKLVEFEDWPTQGNVEFVPAMYCSELEHVLRAKLREICLMKGLNADEAQKKSGEQMSKLIEAIMDCTVIQDEFSH